MHIDALTAVMNPNHADADLKSRLIESDLEVRKNAYFADKVKVTSLGGIAILLTNKTGSDSVDGELVSAHTSIADAVEQSSTTSVTTIGLFESSSVPDGSEAWVVVSGVAVVHMDNNSVDLGDRVVSSTSIAGRGLASNTPSNTAHFTEIGHCIQAGAANSTVRCIIHFN